MILSLIRTIVKINDLKITFRMKYLARSCKDRNNCQYMFNTPMALKIDIASTLSSHFKRVAGNFSDYASFE